MADDALIHGRWHRALDDLSSEPDGPIRDHIEAHDARVRRDLAAKVEAVLTTWQRELADYPDTEGGRAARAAVRIAAGEVQDALADALPQDAAVEPAQ